MNYDVDKLEIGPTREGYVEYRYFYSNHREELKDIVGFGGKDLPEKFWRPPEEWNPANRLSLGEIEELIRGQIEKERKIIPCM